MKISTVGSIHGIHCAGCRYSFESYEMDASEGYVHGGLIYCNSDCQMENEARSIESAEWDSLSEEY